MKKFEAFIGEKFSSLFKIKKDKIIYVGRDKIKENFFWMGYSGMIENREEKLFRDNENMFRCKEKVIVISPIPEIELVTYDRRAGKFKLKIRQEEKPFHFQMTNKGLLKSDKGKIIEMLSKSGIECDADIYFILLENYARYLMKQEYKKQKELEKKRVGQIKVGWGFTEQFHYGFLPFCKTKMEEKYDKIFLDGLCTDDNFRDIFQNRKINVEFNQIQGVLELFKNVPILTQVFSYTLYSVIFYMGVKEKDELEKEPFALNIISNSASLAGKVANVFCNLLKMDLNGLTSGIFWDIDKVEEKSLKELWGVPVIITSGTGEISGSDKRLKPLKELKSYKRIPVCPIYINRKIMKNIHVVNCDVNNLPHELKIDKKFREYRAGVVRLIYLFLNALDCPKPDRKEVRKKREEIFKGLQINMNDASEQDEYYRDLYTSFKFLLDYLSKRFTKASEEEFLNELHNSIQNCFFEDSNQAKLEPETIITKLKKFIDATLQKEESIEDELKKTVLSKRDTGNDKKECYWLMAESWYNKLCAYDEDIKKFQVTEEEINNILKRMEMWQPGSNGGLTNERRMNGTKARYLLVYKNKIDEFCEAYSSTNKSKHDNNLNKKISAEESELMDVPKEC